MGVERGEGPATLRLNRVTWAFLINNIFDNDIDLVTKP